MSGYVSKVSINGVQSLVGSTLYGICGTDANEANKTVNATDNNSDKFINTNYNNLIQGTTIHVKFTQGNNIASNMTLAVGQTAAKPVVGDCVCPANTIISFTFDESESWVVNDNVKTEYVFKTAYNASTNKALTESDIGDAAPKGVVTDLEHNTSSTDLPTAATVAAYVDLRTAGLSGLTGAMHFRGNVNELPEATSAETYSTYDAGDVVLGPNNKEYVYDKSASGAASSQWIELGDEGSYALKSNTETITHIATAGTATVHSATILNAGSAASLSIEENTNTAASLNYDPVSIPVVSTANTPTTAVVSDGILTITPGTALGFGENIGASVINSFNANVPADIRFTPNVVPSIQIDDVSVSQITTDEATVVVP